MLLWRQKWKRQTTYEANDLIDLKVCVNKLNQIWILQIIQHYKKQDIPQGQMATRKILVIQAHSQLSKKPEGICDFQCKGLRRKEIESTVCLVSS